MNMPKVVSKIDNFAVSSREYLSHELVLFVLMFVNIIENVVVHQELYLGDSYRSQAN